MATTLYGIKNCEMFLLEGPQKSPRNTWALNHSYQPITNRLILLKL
ncbi:hypothetical protein JD515_02360 [Aeromonas caviae]|nr:hypothetical protein [Aeromonas caviae]MBL0605002.1 hypothetical protein [Aeromonas caviae]